MLEITDSQRVFELERRQANDLSGQAALFDLIPFIQLIFCRFYIK